MNKFTYTDFYNQWLGQSSSLGGNYNQCVTLFKEFLNKAGYPSPERAIGGSGGAREIWYRREALGYGDYFEFTQVGQPGDWFIWDSVYGWWQGTYYGHVAMLIKDNGNGTGQFLGMNQGYSQSPANVQTLTYNGSCGVLHYKGYGGSSSSSDFDTSKLEKEHAKATFTVDKLNARVNSPNGTVCRQYNSGDTVEYQYKYVGNGHRYIAWDEASNLILVAVSESEDYNSTRWATFSAIEESSSEPSVELTDEHGWAKYKVDQVNVRKGSATGDVAKQVNSGDVVEYTQKCVTNGHRYISYLEGDTRYYVVCSPNEERSTEYCDFYTENPNASTTESKEEPTDSTNGFSSVNEGEYENHNQVDETLSCDGVTVDLVSKEMYSYKCPYSMEPKTIVVHNASTPSGTAKSLNQYLHNHKDYKSWHFSVDDKEIYESLPLNRNAFATGDGAYGLGNRTGIHVEIAKDNESDSTEEWQASRKNGAKLVAILLKKYGWTIDKVTKHQDYKMSDGTYKYCPHKILDEGWDDFVKLIQSELDELNNPKTDKKEDETKTDDKDSTSNTNSKIDTEKANTLISLLIKLVKKLLGIFK